MTTILVVERLLKPGIMNKIVQTILAILVLAVFCVGLFFGLVYLGDNYLQPPVVVEESFESLGIEKILLEIEDIDNQIKSLESQQEVISNQIAQLKANKQESVIKLNKLLDQIREISGGFPSQ